KGSKVFAYCRGDSLIRGRCQPNAVAGFHLPAVEKVIWRFPPPARAEQDGIFVVVLLVVIRENVM
ncbi:hypothetical protein E4U44_006389, partial [Claviceps purpurea]